MRESESARLFNLGFRLPEKRSGRLGVNGFVNNRYQSGFWCMDEIVNERASVFACHNGRARGNGTVTNRCFCAYGGFKVEIDPQGACQNGSESGFRYR